MAHFSNHHTYSRQHIYSGGKSIHKHTNCVNVKYTYRQPKGGIVDEVQTVQEQKILIQEAQNIFPGCISSTPSPPSHSIVVVKNFNPLISSDDIKRDIEEKYQISCKICRYCSYKNKEPLPIISIKTDKNNSELFLKEEILLFNHTFLCEAYKQPIICCFHCQKFGHKSHICQSQNICANCDRPVSSYNQPYSNSPNCANRCRNQRSSSNICPVFKSLSSVIAYSYKNENPTT